MACDTCGHTLASLTGHRDEPVQMYYCERCGTLVLDNLISKRKTVYVPKLVERCREFETQVVVNAVDESELRDWNRTGIAESINLPESRPCESNKN